MPQLGQTVAPLGTSREQEGQLTGLGVIGGGFYQRSLFGVRWPGTAFTPIDKVMLRYTKAVPGHRTPKELSQLPATLSSSQ